MTIAYSRPDDDAPSTMCSGCDGKKQAPIAGYFQIGGLEFFLCQECGRDAANVIGFACIRDGGWSKLEPKKKRKI